MAAKTEAMAAGNFLPVIEDQESAAASRGRTTACRRTEECLHTPRETEVEAEVEAEVVVVEEQRKESAAASEECLHTLRETEVEAKVEAEVVVMEEQRKDETEVQVEADVPTAMQEVVVDAVEVANASAESIVDTTSSSTADVPTTSSTTASSTAQAADKEKEKSVWCYLKWEEVNQGTLFIVWSRKDDATDALAVFEPSKPVPAFKFKNNGGKSELLREAAGGGGPYTKRYYQGLCTFVKQARQLDAKLMLLSETIPAQVVMNRDDHSVQRLACQQWYSVGCTAHPAPLAVAAIHPSKTDFEVQNMEIAQFVDKGHVIGASLLLE
jgi:hypothetical protein